MKRFILFSMILLLLAACRDSDIVTPEATNSNVENVSTTSATPPPTAEPTSNIDELLAMIDTMENWSSYQSVSSFSETYENDDYPDSEFHIDKQYVADPAQVYIFSSMIGFSSSTIEQYASYEYADGGFESMEDGDFYDMDSEAVDTILKNSLPSRAELVRAVLNNATDISKSDDTFIIELDSSSLASIFESMQASFLYNAKSNELENETLSILTIDTGTFHSGEVSIVTDGSNIITYSLMFDVTSEISGRNQSTFSETFDLVNEIEEIKAPEELMMGIGVN